jgi:hypothetical protein
LTSWRYKNKLHEDQEQKETWDQRKSSSKIWLQKNRQSGSSDANVSVIRGELEMKSHHPSFIRSFIHSFIHLVVCLTKGPTPLPKRAVHIGRSRVSSFKWEYRLLSLRSSSSFLLLLPRLPVTSILPFIFPSITRCRRQFLRKMWPIQLAFRLLISCRIFLCSLTLILLQVIILRLRKLWGARSPRNWWRKFW